MSCRLKIIGSEPRLRSMLCRWPAIVATGGHTLVEFDVRTPDARQARAIYAALVTEYSFTPLDTTTPDAPTKAPALMPEDVQDETEYTFIPQYAGG